MMADARRNVLHTVAKTFSGCGILLGNLSQDSIQLGKCRVAWFLEEIEEWIETRRRLSRPLRST